MFLRQPSWFSALSNLYQQCHTLSFVGNIMGQLQDLSMEVCSWRIVELSLGGAMELIHGSMFVKGDPKIPSCFELKNTSV